MGKRSLNDLEEQIRQLEAKLAAGSDRCASAFTFSSAFELSFCMCALRKLFTASVSLLRGEVRSDPLSLSAFPRPSDGDGDTAAATVSDGLEPIPPLPDHLKPEYYVANKGAAPQARWR